MSIQIELVGHVSGALIHKRAPYTALEAIREWIEKEFPLTVFSKHAEETSYSVSLHPLAEPATFTIEGKTIHFKALTNGVGPGYHAKLVEALDQLTIAAHVKWHEHDPFVDHSGYFSNRDFDRLKSYFSRWLRHTCLSVGESRHGAPIGLTVGNIEYPGYALTPMGPRPKEWVQTVASGSALGDDYWAWPEKALDSEFFVRYALSIMWSLIDWHSIQSNRQKAIMIMAHDALVKAFSLDPGNPHIPWQSWKELCDISLQQFPATAPNPLPQGEPIGYFRRTEDSQVRDQMHS